MNDPNKKTVRSFQCRDALWETFGLLAADLECSVDYLINEAMKQYARQRGARSIVPDPARVDAPAPGPASAIGAPSGQTGPGLPPPRPPPRAPLPLPAPTGAPPPGGQPPWASPYGAMQPHSGGALGPPRMGAQPPPYHPHSHRPHPPAPPAQVARSAPPAHPAAPPPGAPALAAIYAGARFAVNKDRFVIGRGKQAVDLTIKDPNISRQHAMIEQQGGQYFLVDMGSTNGLECNGERVVRRAIAEGDVVRICDHEVRFTFRRG